jgi:hypothetical protein
VVERDIRPDELGNLMVLFSSNNDGVKTLGTIDNYRMTPGIIPYFANF